MNTNEKGPIYGVHLIQTLPLGTSGGMLQQMPTGQDLRDVRTISERTVAGYEVLLSHYLAKAERVKELESLVALLEEEVKEK